MSRRGNKRALILVDIQNDFLPGGSLAVPHGDEVIPFVNRLMQEPFELIVATQDFHPLHHISFASTHGKNVGERIVIGSIEQMLWPDHCVQATAGAEVSDQLDKAKVDAYVKKGSDVAVDSYSAFFDQKGKETTLDGLLQSYGIGELHIVGLATDYCVFYTACDALKLGYRVIVHTEGCRGISAEGCKAALASLRDSGATVVWVEQREI
jgi:nicotinamidase/pyrazinamidase